MLCNTINFFLFVGCNCWGFFPQGQYLTEMPSLVDGISMGIFIHYKKLRQGEENGFNNSFNPGESHTKLPKKSSLFLML